MIKHNHATTSNTRQCFETFIGCTVKGIAYNDGTHVIFACGWALTVNANGAHWTTAPDDVGKIIQQERKELESTRERLRAVLRLAGEP